MKNFNKHEVEDQLQIFREIKSRCISIFRRF